MQRTAPIPSPPIHFFNINKGTWFPKPFVPLGRESLIWEVASLIIKYQSALLLLFVFLLQFDISKLPVPCRVSA